MPRIAGCPEVSFRAAGRTVDAAKFRTHDRRGADKKDPSRSTRAGPLSASGLAEI